MRSVSSIKTVVGTSGDDTMVANGSGTNTTTIIGAGGDDYIVGGAGDDVLAGGVGDDILSGGAGDGTFIISVSDEDGFRDTGTDTITDFQLTDKISFNGFELLKSEDGSLPGESNYVKKQFNELFESLLKNFGGEYLKCAINY